MPVLCSSVQVVDSARDFGVVTDSHLTMADPLCDASVTAGRGAGCAQRSAVIGSWLLCVGQSGVGNADNAVGYA